MAHIIEEKSGQDYDAFLSERLLKPLGLCKTFRGGAAVERDENMALPYARLEDASYFQLALGNYFENQSGRSIVCGMWASIEDALMWSKAILERERIEKEGRAEQNLFGDPTLSHFER